MTNLCFGTFKSYLTCTNCGEFFQARLYMKIRIPIAYYVCECGQHFEKHVEDIYGGRL